jgi:LysR family hydrogen peroxide-inducible transcriptional activator
MKLSPWSFTLRQLQYVVAVAETLSFRAAAERCHVAQPSLSAQLERALGVRGCGCSSAIAGVCC